MEIQTEKASDCPRVSILIPCYDRPDDLTNTLQHCLRQTGCSHEIVIIDDGTPNDAVAAVAAAFPQCRYVRLDANVGLIKARNIGMTRCKGEYVVNLDDDSWLVDPRALDRIVAFMDRSPDVAVLALNVDQPASGLLWNPSAQPVPVGNYTGCGNVQRKALIAEVGGFIAEFIRQGEELEQSMRIIAANYKVVAMPSIQVIHNESTVNRDVRKICSMEAVNILRREAILAPAPLIPFGFLLFARYYMSNFRNIDGRIVRSQLFDRPNSLFALLKRYRKPISVVAYLRCLRLRRQPLPRAA